MRDDAVCIVGVGESDDIGSTPHCSGLALQAQASRNALADAGLKRSDIDGLLTQTGGRMPPITFSIQCTRDITPSYRPKLLCLLDRPRCAGDDSEESG
jgi:hypothetical protein